MTERTRSEELIDRYEKLRCELEEVERTAFVAIAEIGCLATVDAVSKWKALAALTQRMDVIDEELVELEYRLPPSYSYGTAESDEPQNVVTESR